MTTPAPPPDDLDLTADDALAVNTDKDLTPDDPEQDDVAQEPIPEGDVQDDADTDTAEVTP